MTPLLNAVQLLERKRHFEEVPFERYTPEHWSLIDEKLPGYGPQWFRQLTMDFRIGGATFHFEVAAGVEWKGHCSICRPSHALWFVYHPMTAWIVEGMFKHRYMFFARDNDYYDFGWVLRDDGDPNPQVFFFENSAWDGGEASEENGLVRIGLTLSEFLEFGAKWAPKTTPAK